MAKDIVFEDRIFRVVDDCLPLYCFRRLNDEEQSVFEAWARLQKPGTVVNPTWHPAIQSELLLSGRGVEG